MMSKILLRMFSLWYLSVTCASLHISMKSPQVRDHKKVNLTSSVPYWNLPPLWKVGCTLTRSIPGLQSISFSPDPHSNYKCQRPAPNVVPIFCGYQHPTSVGVATIFLYALSGASVRLVCIQSLISSRFVENICWINISDDQASHNHRALHNASRLQYWIKAPLSNWWADFPRYISKSCGIKKNHLAESTSGILTEWTLL